MKSSEYTNGSDPILLTIIYNLRASVMRLAVQCVHLVPSNHLKKYESIEDGRGHYLVICESGKIFRHQVQTSVLTIMAIIVYVKTNNLATELSVFVKLHRLF